MPEYKPIYTSHRPAKAREATNTSLNATTPQKRPRKLARWVIVMTLMSLLGVGIQNAYSSLADSDFFLIAHIRVERNTMMSEAEVVALSQLQVGTNLFANDITAANRTPGTTPDGQKGIATQRTTGNTGHSR